jgi:hypothetical protein
LVGIIWVPIIVISSISGTYHRINGINKHAYNALMELNPIETQSKPSAKIEKIIEPIPFSSKTPPPIKKYDAKIEYFIGVDGEQMGPYDLEKIKLLLEFKNINESTLIWKEGMNDWDTLSNIEELASELTN